MRSKLNLVLDNLSDSQVEYIYHLLKKLFGVDVERKE